MLLELEQSFGDAGFISVDDVLVESGVQGSLASAGTSRTEKGEGCSLAVLGTGS